jgi:hypothetical protein
VDLRRRKPRWPTVRETSIYVQKYYLLSLPYIATTTSATSKATPSYASSTSNFFEYYYLHADVAVCSVQPQQIIPDGGCSVVTCTSAGCPCNQVSGAHHRSECRITPVFPGLPPRGHLWHLWRHRSRRPGHPCLREFGFYCHVSPFAVRLSFEL